MKLTKYLFTSLTSLILLNCSHEVTTDISEKNTGKESSRPQNSIDLIWTNTRPISLNFKTASMKCLDKVYQQPDYTIEKHESPPKNNLQIISFKDLDFDAIVPVMKLKKGFTPLKTKALGLCYYFPYLTPPDPRDFYKTVGNVKIDMLPADNDPRYILTGEMNGCSLFITREPYENEFRIWHFPSPDSYKKQLQLFKSRFKGKIVAELNEAQYSGDVSKGEIEGFNYLFYNDTNQKWELTCIPLKRIITTDPKSLKKWYGNYVARSSKSAFKKTLNFDRIIY